MSTTAADEQDVPLDTARAGRSLHPDSLPRMAGEHSFAALLFEPCRCLTFALLVACTRRTYGPFLIYANQGETTARPPGTTLYLNTAKEVRQVALLLRPRPFVRGRPTAAASPAASSSPPLRVGPEAPTASPAPSSSSVRPHLHLRLPVPVRARGYWYYNIHRRHQGRFSDPPRPPRHLRAARVEKRHARQLHATLTWSSTSPPAQSTGHRQTSSGRPIRYGPTAVGDRSTGPRQLGSITLAGMSSRWWDTVRPLPTLQFPNGTHYRVDMTGGQSRAGVDTHSGRRDWNFEHVPVPSITRGRNEG